MKMNIPISHIIKVPEMPALLISNFNLSTICTALNGAVFFYAKYIQLVNISLM
jgi:hypothetical protein